MNRYTLYAAGFLLAALTYAFAGAPPFFNLLATVPAYYCVYKSARFKTWEGGYVPPRP